VRARVLGILLLATLVGVAGGLAVGWLQQPRPAAGGTATPLPAASPSLPIDPTTPPRTFAEDIDYPPLLPGLIFKSFRMANSQQAWRVPFPVGWVATNVDTDEEVPRDKWSSSDELRFRPADEPAEGGFSIRVKLVNSRMTTQAMVDAKADALQQEDIVEWIDEQSDVLKFSYATSSDHLRFNYFQWFAAPGRSEATLEMSVVGRERDLDGLEALFAAFESTLDAIE
jgi:hypothetical protein